MLLSRYEESIVGIQLTFEIRVGYTYITICTSERSEELIFIKNNLVINTDKDFVTNDEINDGKLICYSNFY